MRRLVHAILATAILVGCDAGPFAPAGSLDPAGLAVHLDFGPSASEEFRIAFDKSDFLAVQVTGAEAVVLDTVVSISPAEEIRVRLPIRSVAEDVAHHVNAQLRRGADDLFRGDSPVTLARNRTSTVEVTLDPVPADIQLLPQAPPPLTALGESIQIEATVVFATGDPIPDLPVTWSSNDPSVVIVDETGLVTAIGEGTAQVLARHQEVEAAIQVEVSAQVESVIVEPAVETLLIEDSRALSATALDRNGNEVERAFVWESSNPAVASVDGAGVVTGLSEGEAIITASTEGVSGQSTITVVRGFEEVVFEDANLEEAVRQALEIPEGPIFDTDMLELIDFAAEGLGIVELTGLEFAEELTNLSLLENRILDLAPLAGLTNLENLVLNTNFIEEIGPLVDNEGLGEGDEVDLRNNPLSETAACQDVPTLEARGVTVLVSQPCG